MPILNRIADFHDDLTAWRRDIHAHPELGYEEERASLWLAEMLADAGFAVETGVCDLPTAFIARAGSGPLHIAICCEYDALPGVVESAVIGCPHPDFGEAVVAVVAGEGDETAMIAAARIQLAVFKCPKRVLFVPDLPRNAMGKVLKADLRRTYADVFKAQ